MIEMTANRVHAQPLHAPGGGAGAAADGMRPSRQKARNLR